MSNPKIVIDFTQGDLENLIDGKQFDWTYTADDGQEIDVHLFNEDM